MMKKKKEAILSTNKFLLLTEAEEEGYFKCKWNFLHSRVESSSSKDFFFASLS